MKKSIHYLKNFSAWLLPYSCILCGSISCHTQDICKKCLLELPHLTYACPSCAKPFLDIKQNLLCGTCLTQSPPFNRTLALYIYQSPITQIIMDLKFGHALLNARILGELLIKKICEQECYQTVLPEVIIPMPLHPLRLKERGFNQAVEISRPIANKLKLPLDLHSCQRIKHTVAQATLPAKKRLQNIKGAFKTEDNFPFKYVAIVDDVITTGQTVTEFSHVLRKAGVEKIDIWCCARPVF